MSTPKPTAHLVTAALLALVATGCSGPEPAAPANAEGTAIEHVDPEALKGAVEIAEPGLPATPHTESPAEPETSAEGNTAMSDTESPEPHDGNPVLTGDWVLLRIGGEPLADGLEPPTLTVGEDGAVSGFAGVNRYSGQLDTAGATLFGPLMMTKMAGPPALNDLETTFTAILTAATTARHDGDGNLVLTTPGQGELVFGKGAAE